MEYLEEAHAQVVELLTQPSAATERASTSAALERHLTRLAALFEPEATSWHALGRSLSLADGALAPIFTYIEILGAARGQSCLTAVPRLLRFWKGAARSDACRGAPPWPARERVAEPTD